MVSTELLKMFDARWREVQEALRRLQDEAGRTARRERAEVAGSVPVYPSAADLPTAGVEGRLASAGGKLYFDDGAAWREVQLV